MDIKVAEKLEDSFCKVLRDYAEKGAISVSSVELAKNALSGLVKLKMLDEMDRHEKSRTNHESYQRYMDSGNRRSYDDSYSNGHYMQDRMIAKLEEMYSQAKTDQERQMVDEWIKQLESGK